MRDTIADLVRHIRPHDALEHAHIAATLAWIDSGAGLFRTHTPATPPQHLVSYFVLFDQARGALLLLDHRKAGLWLPSGGHVEPDEHPADTVRREAHEELALVAEFFWPEPVFITVTETVGSTAGHTDVSLWYVLRGDANALPWFDQAEAYALRWFPLAALPLHRADPHLGRFVAKLREQLAAASA